MRKVTLSGVRKRLRGAVRAALDAAHSPNGEIRTLAGERPEAFAVGLNRWIERYSGKNRAEYPPGWRTQLADIRREQHSRVAVVMHVYYPHLVEELFDELAAVPVPFDLYITNATGAPLELPRSPANAMRVHVLDVPNRGRDLLPLVLLVNAGLLNPYELVLKVHTKESAWRSDHELGGTGAQWRRSLLDQLLGARENVEDILAAFASDPTLGLVTADGNVLGPEYWGDNDEIAGHLLARIQLEPDRATLRFAAGSMYWVRGFVLQGLYAFDLSVLDFEGEAGQVNYTTAHALERVIGIVTREAGFHLVERGSLEASAGVDPIGYWTSAERVPRARVIPFYLPQFHAFRENNLWWGEGFTEWSNVTGARPVFRGHAQPLLPADFGFYDLSGSKIRRRQYDAARRSGIEGFMYYYYWFAGRKLMDMPVERLVESEDDHPFCIMWANENWSRRWDGSDDDILIAQDYDAAPAEGFIDDIAHLLRDRRYLRVDGRALLAVYRINQIPEFERVMASWRTRARELGIGELMILTGDVGAGMEGLDGDPRLHGLDGSFEFPPHNTHWVFDDLRRRGLDPRFTGRTMKYSNTVAAAEADLRLPLLPHRNPGVMVGFDNTARRQWMPDIWFGSNPYTFRRWLDETASALALRPREERLLFVNAWNEWAESAVLEPSARHGHTFLLAVRDAILR